MNAPINLHLPRIPEALARHQEACPISLKYSKSPLSFRRDVLNLKDMCCKWWLERVQNNLKNDINRNILFSLHRYVSQLPKTIRSSIIENALKSGGLHLAHGSREIPSVNRCLVFLSSDMDVSEIVYLSFRNLKDGNVHSSLDFDLIHRSGEGLKKVFLILPNEYSNIIKKSMNELLRTCKLLTHVTIQNASDNALVLVTRYCKNVLSLDISGSSEVTDEGISLAVVNLKWPNTSNNLRTFDVGQTGITLDGMMHLLASLDSIKSYGSMDVVESIEGLIQMTENSSYYCALEEATLKCATINRIQTLSKHCPNLYMLKIIYREPHGASLNDLRLIRNLSKIELEVWHPFSFTRAQFQEFIWAIGPKLEHLKVSGDVYWEGDFGFIFGQCPLIKELSFPSLNVPTKESLSIFTSNESVALMYLTVSIEE